MSRKRKLILNTITSLLSQLIAVACGLILPRMFLVYYGSSVNGLVSSITQFLEIIALCECGVGAVVQSALYAPLAEKDCTELSKIVKSSEKFFRGIAYILVAYVFVLVLIYPIIVQKQFDYFFSAGLIIIISVTTFVQYYFGITYRLLLNADQLGYIQLGMNCGILILNAVVCVSLIKLNMPIYVVKAASALVHIIQPFFLRHYVLSHYEINKDVVIYSEPIKQKWNGLAQHVSYVVLNNTDTIVLTIFSSLKNVSVYGVYYLVVSGIQQFITAATAGFQSLLGNMLAKKEFVTLNKTFNAIEWFFHMLVTLVFEITGLLIIPFVKVYTKGITDVNYIVPTFALLMVLAQASYSLRQPYKMIIKAAGHYKETQVASIIESVINIIVSVVLVFRYGLIGVAIGTLSAMTFMTLYYVIYLSNNILNRKVVFFVKNIIVDGICCFVMTLTFTKFLPICFTNVSYVGWLLLAVKVSFICLAEVMIVNIVFCRKEIINIYHLFSKKNS